VTGGARKASSVPDAVRRAVERTFQSTLGSAALTRERAQDLADDVLRRAEEGAVRARRGVREAGHRQREAAVGVGDRLRDAIAELRGIGAEEVKDLRSEVEQLRRRVDELERKVRAGSTTNRPKAATGTRAGAAKARQKRSKSS
jgi:polyhydroxyalkanoate synthesis regulator phasin